MTFVFSLVTTVFNEIARIDKTIQDIENQKLLPAEIVITDAGSTDGTYERLLKWKADSNIIISILQLPGCNVAQGRNYSIKEASCDLIVSTDFGCRFHPDWLHSLIAPFSDESVKIVGGAFSVIESDIQTISARANYILSDGYNSPLDETFIPSSRSIAYYKKVWDVAGGYPEWLTLAADDLVFGMVLKKLGYKFYIVEKPHVYWGRHASAKAYGKEAFRYGLGDGEAEVNLKQFLFKLIETKLRYGFLVFLVILSIGIAIAIFPPISFLILIVFLPGFKSYLYAFKMWRKYKSAKYDFRVFLQSLYLIELSRWNYIKGYIKGYVFKPKHKKVPAKKLRSFLKASFTPSKFSYE